MAKKERLHQTFDELQETLDRALVLPDWEESNPESDSYVKNRTHWEEDCEITETLTVERIDYTGSRGTSPSDCGLVFTLPDGTALERMPEISKPNMAGWKMPGGWKYGAGDFGVTARFINGECVLSVGRPGTSSTAPYDDTGSSLIPSEFIPAPVTLTRVARGTIVHKLDNKYLDMDTEPAPGSEKPVTSGGIFESLDDKADAEAVEEDLTNLEIITLLGLN